MRLEFEAVRDAYYKLLEEQKNEKKGTKKIKNKRKTIKQEAYWTFVTSTVLELKAQDPGHPGQTYVEQACAMFMGVDTMPEAAKPNAATAKAKGKPKVNAKAETKPKAKAAKAKAKCESKPKAKAAKSKAKAAAKLKAKLVTATPEAGDTKKGGIDKRAKHDSSSDWQSFRRAATTDDEKEDTKEKDNDELFEESDEADNDEGEEEEEEEDDNEGEVEEEVEE